MVKLGSSFASTGLSADFWTALALSISLVAGIAYASPAFVKSSFTEYYATVVGGIFLLISGFFDIVDGSVARVTGKSSKKGAFLDSTFDKVAEVTIFAGIAYGHLADTFWCIIALGMSLLVSYTRARAESLNVDLRGIGIGERAERLLILAVVGMLPIRGFSNIAAMNWALIIVSIVAGITLVQRIWATSRKLSFT
jgi:archaetidylinositol phosphate synthase